jgi:CheY-like chemotaxis protein
VTKIKYILNLIFKSFRPKRRLGVKNSIESLNLDKLAESHGLTLERVGRFLESELNWIYQKQILLNSIDFNLEISDVDQLAEFSALELFLDKTGRKRFITSNPDLIMSSGARYKSLQRSASEFQLASFQSLESALKKFKVVKEVLEVVPQAQRLSFSVFLLSLLDCLELGARRVEYYGGRYVATSEVDKYEGVVPLEVVRLVKDFLSKDFILPMEVLFKQIGIKSFPSYGLTPEGFFIAVESMQEQKGASSVDRYKHILLVDDDQRFGDILKRGISLKGFRVSVTGSAKQAIEYLNTPGVKIDLVVSDFHMPNYSGASLIASIREVDKNLPIIGLTGDTHPESHISFISAGANAIVRKSDDPKVLLAWIYKLLNEDRQLKVA